MLSRLSERIEKMCLKFAKKCLKHPVNRRLFPLNKNKHEKNPDGSLQLEGGDGPPLDIDAFFQI